MRRRIARRRGATLIELLITISLLGMIAGVATSAIRRADPPRGDDPARVLAESLRVAVAQSRSVSLAIGTSSGVLLATVRPDGSVVADSALHVDRLTGRPANAR